MKKVENKNWYADYYRSTDDKDFNLIHFVRDYLFQQRLRFIIYFRRAQSTKSKLIRAFFDWKLYRLSRKYGIEIKSNTKIGRGFLLCHAYNITVTPFATIGENVTMMKGSTIGASRSGSPVIGNNVYIGLNSTVIGGIKIGNNVLIAPNTLVNMDVPDDSLVIGSPGTIVPKENPTGPYIWKIWNH